MPDTEERYQVVLGSESAHCCFEATVVDTTRPILDRSGKPMNYDGRVHYEAVCECFEQDDAQMIAKALNAASISKEEERHG
jgi:hypothetical protein